MQISLRERKDKEKVLKSSRVPSYLLFILCLLSATGCNTIPHTNRQMQYPGFWIARDSFADKIILDQTGVSAFNSKTGKDLGLIKDLLRIGFAYSRKDLIFSLRNDLDGFTKQKLYLKDLREAGRVFYQEAEKQINFAAIPAQINARYGFVCHSADQRLLPTDEILTSAPGDLAFDELQNSSLDIGTPLVILHESKNGLWVYTQSPTSSGWIRKDSLVFCEFSDFKSFLEKGSFVIVVSAKADIFQDPALTQYIGRVRMGTKFPLAGNSNPGVAKVIIPSRDKNGKFIEQEVYLKKKDVNFGYLIYTPRNIIQQAFKLLNVPYSWGGKGGEQDCSGFIQEVFSTVGIILPRNSSEQGRVGRLLNSLNKQAIGGVTILQLKGHILLYLGMYAGQPYAIHDIHAYTQKQWWGGFSARKLNRVVVSDLSLGEGSRKGSLFERIVFIRNIES